MKKLVFALSLAFLSQPALAEIKISPENCFYNSDRSNAATVDRCRKQIAERDAKKRAEMITNMHNKQVRKEMAHLADVGIKEELISKAVLEEDISILKGDEVAEKWFYLKKYGRKDCFKSLPNEIANKIFKWRNEEETWAMFCRNSTEMKNFLKR